jgi:hypothetical protein
MFYVSVVQLVSRRPHPAETTWNEAREIVYLLLVSTEQFIFFL